MWGYEVRAQTEKPLVSAMPRRAYPVLVNLAELIPAREPLSVKADYFKRCLDETVSALQAV